MSAGSDRPGTDFASYRQTLFDQRLLLPSGTDGIYAISAELTLVISGIEHLVQLAGRDEHAEVVRFPPTVTRSLVERAGYVRSFPDLLGVVSSFDGDDREHRLLLRDLDEGRAWTEHLHPSDVALCPAACHPLYPTLDKSLAPGGRCFDVYGYVFRHEPSEDPARMQSFRQYEYVYVGEAARAEAHRDRWRDRAAELLASLELDVRVVLANDPFFGRVGLTLSDSQREQELKWEVVAPTGPGELPTAIASANLHLDHFGGEYGIEAADGVAHSACVGFGVERIALALLWQHGLDASRWSTALRDRLGLR